MHLINYDNIEEAIDLERQAFIKVQAFSDDSESVRASNEAIVILKFLKKIQTDLKLLYDQYPSLEDLFNKEFVNFKDFSSLEYVLEACFLDDFLFPDNEDFPLTSPVDGKFQKNYLDDYLDFFESYTKKKKDEFIEIIS